MPEELARKALSQNWFERAIRIGHLARGAVFGTIGFLGAATAGRRPRGNTRFPGALEALAEQPLDVLFIIVLSLGLLAFDCASRPGTKIQRVTDSTMPTGALRPAEP